MPLLSWFRAGPGIGIPLLGVFWLPASPREVDRGIFFSNASQEPISRCMSTAAGTTHSVALDPKVQLVIEERPVRRLDRLARPGIKRP